MVPGTWRRGVDPAELRQRLSDDRSHRIKALLVVHNETSTGVTTRLPEIRKAMNDAKHPALLLVDAVSSLGSIDLRHDEWGLDVTLSGSQKGLMLPPGLSFNAISQKALAASKTAKSPRRGGRDSPPTPAVTFRPHLRRTVVRPAEVLRMLAEEGLQRLADINGWHRRLGGGAAGSSRSLCERATNSVRSCRLCDARRPRCRSLQADRARPLQHVARLRARAPQEQGVPDWPSRRFQRADVDWHAWRCRAWFGRCGGSVHAGRHCRGHGVVVVRW